MEQYLIDDWGVISFENLKSETEIAGVFNYDFVKTQVEEGQEYFYEDLEFIVKIQDRFYNVHLDLEWTQQRRDYFPPVFQFDGVKSITSKEIEKPLPKEKRQWNWKMELNDDQFVRLIQFLKDNKIENSFS